MKPITQEWVTKAEGDFGTAQRELQVQQSPNYDAVCFHSQQCAEKYLKACLQEAEIAFGKTHDLTTLLDLLLSLEPSWDNLRPILDALTTYAVELRYPGASANKQLADQAFQDCDKVRKIVRQHLTTNIRQCQF
jgi:HEPN domain-containing protein